MTNHLLEVRELSVSYPTSRFFRARERPTVHDVSFTIRPGETFGLVGESGSGKSTIARTIARLTAVSSGRLLFEGRDITRARPGVETGIQMVFQDPAGSLDPHLSVVQSVQDALRRTVSDRRRRADRAAGLLVHAGLDERFHRRRPHALSGGQKQRAAIARALATEPRLLIADEPVSALDVVVQAQILDLLLDLQERDGLAILLISHDLTVVHHMADDIGVMTGGRIVEIGRADDVVQRPQHQYTQELLRAVPGHPSAATDHRRKGIQ